VKKQRNKEQKRREMIKSREIKEILRQEVKKKRDYTKI
jgi:hypothetical protein